MALAMPRKGTSGQQSRGGSSGSSAVSWGSLGPQRSTANDVPRPKANPLLGLMQGQFAPYQAEMTNNANYAFTDIGRVGANTQWGTRWANTDYNLQNQLNNIDIQGVGIDKAGQQRLLNPGGVYDVQQRGVDASRGLLSRELANQMRGFDIDAAANQRTFGTNMRGASSDATARGATVSQGLRDKNTDIIKQLWEGIGQNQVGREGARIGNERGNISLNNEQAGLTENKAQTADRIKQYDLQAQKLGINGTQLKNTLQQGLEKLNLDAQVSVDDIVRNLTSKNAATAQQAMQLYSQLLDYGGYIPK